MSDHVHLWSWVWHGPTTLRPYDKHETLVSVRVCDCGEVEAISAEPTITPSRAARVADREAQDEDKRAKQRERNRQYQAARRASMESAS